MVNAVLNILQVDYATVTRFLLRTLGSRNIHIKPHDFLPFNPPKKQRSIPSYAEDMLLRYPISAEVENFNYL